MKLSKLFKISSVGAIQEWEIGTELASNPQDGTYIVTRWGKAGGKIQETKDLIKIGKNLGKSNETSANQQATDEALSMWEKKLKSGYVKSLGAAEAGEVDDSVEGGILPMLAKRFDEQGDRIIYPAFAQPKFDGHRCIAMVQKGKCTLWSRTRKLITGLPHINKAIEALGMKKDIILDGELYNHDYRTKFEELTSFIRNPEPKEGHEVVQYHVYDIAGSGSFKWRNGQLKTMIRYEPLICVETKEVEDEDELIIFFEECLAKGYEGAMVRNAEGLYVNKRSLDLQKIKEFQDAEYKIIDVKEGRGKLAGKAIFVCETQEGTQFEAKLKGPQEELAKFWKNPKLAIGRMLTVQYQGITNKNKVPRFPVGLRFREDM